MKINKGSTLIELLILMTIILILSSVILESLTEAKKKNCLKDSNHNYCEKYQSNDIKQEYVW